MSNQTEREKFSTLATDINRALERNDDEEYYRLTHSHPDEILKALRLAALDGGAVSQDVELATLRRQLAEREAEVELLKARISAGIETFNEIARG